MANYKLTIEYDGTNFKGWQVQGKGERTVQGEIVAAYKKLFREDIKLIGSGRTDTGVHALGQVANFHTETPRLPKEIQNALNAHLADDIAIVRVEKVAESFHAQYTAKQKTYRYIILNRELRSPIRRYGMCLVPMPLDIEAMKRAGKLFVGTKDFRSVTSNNRSNLGKSTVRTVYDLRVAKRGSQISIDITADGFLYKMVRNIVGLLIEAGQGKQSNSSITSILRDRNRQAAGVAAKAHGLYLLRVKY